MLLNCVIMCGWVFVYDHKWACENMRVLICVVLVQAFFGVCVGLSVLILARPIC